MRKRNTLSWMCIALGLLIVSIKLFSIRGVILPVRISGASMAPTLFGNHVVYTCDECDFRFRCGDEFAPDDTFTCPNCGAVCEVVEDADRAMGERVVIDRSAFWSTEPRRWDIVAIQRVGQADALEVKRIVGLPGEVVAIEDGDLLVDAVRLRKSLREFNETARLVYDDRHRPTPTLPNRWRADGKETSWETIDQVYRWSESSSNEQRSTEPGKDWLRYHHWSCISDVTPPRPRTSDQVVVDHHPYNHSLSRSPLYPVSDLLVTMHLHVLGDGSMWLATDGDEDRIEAEFDTAKNEVNVRRGKRLLSTKKLPRSFRDGIEVGFGLFDRQVIVALDSSEIVRVPLEGASPLCKSKTPFALGTNIASLEVSQILVHRDLHYLGPQTNESSWVASRVLADDEYLVLGDNPPLSIDSRQWPELVLHRREIIGRVAPFASRSQEIGE